METRTLPLDVQKMGESKVYLCIFGREFRTKERERKALENCFKCLKIIIIILNSRSWGEGGLYIYFGDCLVANMHLMHAFHTWRALSPHRVIFSDVRALSPLLEK